MTIDCSRSLVVGSVAVWTYEGFDVVRDNSNHYKMTAICTNNLRRYCNNDVVIMIWLSNSEVKVTVKYMYNEFGSKSPVYN